MGNRWGKAGFPRAAVPVAELSGRIHLPGSDPPSSPPGPFHRRGQHSTCGKGTEARCTQLEGSHAGLVVLPWRPHHDHPLHSPVGCWVRTGSQTGLRGLEAAPPAAALLAGGPEARPAELCGLAPGGHSWLLSLAPKALQVFSRDEPDKDMYAAPVTSWAQWPGDMELVTVPKAVQGPQLMLRQILSQILQTSASKCPRVGTTISCYMGSNGGTVRRSSRARSGW